MMVKQTIIASAVLITALPGVARQTSSEQKSSPLYNVTVVDRSTKAINYQYRQGPTKIEFRGTVLMPHGKGEATVESKRGRTEIEAKFERLAPPSAYGREFLTYSLWAITPDGASRNLGEIIPGSSNKASLRVTTDLQAFGLIVTAEPFSATRLPSDVVVLENEIRPDTLGSAQPINAKYELMPRGHYTWHVPDQMDANVASMPRVSMSKYEELLAIYEAQNALGIARAAGAEKYSAATYQKAQASFENAQQLQASKAPSGKVIQVAKEASETAEDARVIAEKKAQEAELARAKAEVSQAQQAQLTAEAQTQKALAEAQTARAQAEAERAAREQAEAQAEAAEARQSAAGAARMTPPPTAARQTGFDPPQSELRRRLTAQFGGLLPTRDTPRGVVVTLPDADFRGSQLKPAAMGEVARLATMTAAYPGLQMIVEGYSDDAGGGSAAERAEAVRGILIRQGISQTAVSARDMRNTRPVATNTTPRGREQNRRVEIVVTGDAIGSRASWDRSYSIAPSGFRP
jgi:outer membrane protein OmpA-like peptidoglycan-associated protein